MLYPTLGYSLMDLVISENISSGKVFSNVCLLISDAAVGLELVDHTP